MTHELTDGVHTDQGPVTPVSPYGLHRVIEPEGVLPQAAWKLDPHAPLAGDEVRIAVERLNLDAASFRQLLEEHEGDGAAVREAVGAIVAERGKMHNPVTGSGGMLIGTVTEVGTASPLGLKPGQRVATLVSLTCTPLVLTDISDWNGLSEQVPCTGSAVLFGRSIAAVLPGDLPDEQALAVFDVCGAPALTARVVATVAAKGMTIGYPQRVSPEKTPNPPGPSVVCVIGAAGKSGSLSLAAARSAGATHRIGVVRSPEERQALLAAGRLDAQPLATSVVVADARNPVLLAEKVRAAGGPADVTVVCVDVPGCEHGAVLATAEGGTIVFFSMATSFSAAALGAEALAADVTMLVGNGYSAGHAELALREFRGSRGVQSLFAART
ncbi:L-erythro-3,5-diaminohexanoate dehydrogenase [Kineosporia succinea]|uniref:L-erythro-3,5-diaminohexanoate dehydrogenase n=1 Tax=Kineosporia succinea TaxID=84632 RepID=A0ABT9P7R8_9ACTN|nr:L-erythro-3,5-diaminohexanoate dehydrogenase [Kineosporia succinea]MDP9828747.1 L-erythro-3,5-diaminohexanoate dehydrogenase [Kineosporia succinea]